MLLTLAAGLALTLAWWIVRATPVPLPEAGAPRLPCASYAPFRQPGESPFDPTARVSPDRIEQDLRLLSRLTDCVRTYSVSQGLDAVPAVARKLGMKVKLGAWIGRDSAENERELQRALELTRAHKGTVQLLIVGNEVLLRRELLPAQVAALLQRAQRETQVPVTYADVWEFWLRHAEALRAHVDVVTVHVLPYWEDDPVAVDAAVDHVFDITAQVRRAFPGQPVLVGETGWPAAGRQREGAQPGRVEQARFVRTLVARAQREPLDFNLIEAFDQPWKRLLEGAMGGAWGLYDAAGAPHFGWTGPVAEDAPGAARGLWAAALGALAGLAAGWRRGRAPALALALVGAVVASLGVAQWQAMGVWNRTPLEWAWSGIATFIGYGGALFAARELASRLAGTPRGDTPGLAAAVFGPAVPGRELGAFRGALLFVAATLALQLVLDGRYRAFDAALLAPAALLLLALRLAGERAAADAREERLLCAVLAVCAPALVALEGVHNAQALGFAALLGLLAGASYPRRTNTSAASSAAGTASPAV